jgi:RimJ/RimL family protein N-acetyltransferase
VRTTAGVHLEPADAPSFRPQVEMLYREYLAFLDLRTMPENWRRELATFPGVYGPPDGRFLLASVDGEVAGCAGFRRMDGERCELKRVFVLPAWRRLGVGRTLVTTLLDEARSAGYRFVYLSTLGTLHAAMAMYRELGFEPRERIGEEGWPDDRHFELDLATAVSLRAVRESDLPVLFEHQRDAEAARMAAFPSRDRDAFTAHWTRILADPSVVARTVLVGDEVAGNIGCWEDDGVPLVGYWIGRDHWGRGVATKALRAIVRELGRRPLFARVAEENVASRRVLEKSGFVLVERLEPSPQDGVVELLMRLD